MPLLYFAIIAQYFVFSFSFPRPFDDIKNLFFYSMAICCGLNLISKTNSQKFSFSLNSLSLLLLLFFGFCFLSFSHTYYESLLETSRLLLWLCWILFVSRLNFDPLKKILKISLISFSLIAFLTYLDSVSGFSLWGKLITPNLGMLPPIGHVTYYGDLMALQIPLIIFFMPEKIKSKLIYLVCAYLLGFGIYYSGTRTSILATFAVLILSFILHRFQKRISFKTAFIYCLIIISFSVSYHFLQPINARGDSSYARLKSIFVDDLEEKKLEEVSSSRLSAWKNTLSMIQDKPLRGFGLGSFRFHYFAYAYKNSEQSTATLNTWFMHPHNELLNQVLEKGIFAGFTFILIFMVLYFKTFQVFKQTTKKEKSWIILAFSGLTLSLISWQLSTNFLFPLSRLVSGLYLGILWKLIHPEMKNYKRIVLPNISLKLIAASLALCFILLNNYHFSLYYIQKSKQSTSAEETLEESAKASFFGREAFDPLFNLAHTQLKSGLLEEAKNNLDQLLFIYPEVPAVWMNMGIYYLQKGDLISAQNYFDRVIKFDPSMKDAVSEILEVQ